MILGYPFLFFFVHPISFISFKGMEFIFRIALAILQQARLDLLKLDMEGMLKVSFNFANFKFKSVIIANFAFEVNLVVEEEILSQIFLR